MTSIGAARANTVVGAVMREFPEKRDAHKEVLLLATKLAEDINSLSAEEQQEPSSARPLLDNLRRYLLARRPLFALWWNGGRRALVARRERQAAATY